MGLFDYIKCEMRLPGDGTPPLQFQTKDTPEQYLKAYTITEQGRLVEDESQTRVPYHGDIHFYTDDEDGGWWEYRARFSEDVCTGIAVIEAPTGGNMELGK